MAVSAPGQLTLLAPRAVVAGLASAGAVPLVTVLRVLLHALALLGAAGAKRPLGASWVGRRRTASDPGHQISDRGQKHCHHPALAFPGMEPKRAAIWE